MQLGEDAARDVANRLRRARGQLDGVIAMVEEGRSCRDIATQVAAASRAVDRAGFRVIAAGLRQCLSEGGGDGADAADVEELEKLLLALA